MLTLMLMSAAASKFCDWVHVGIEVYIPPTKYQVKPYSSPWFSAACAAAIVHGNHFSQLYHKDKFSDSKVKFRQASNHCKVVLEAAKLAFVNKTKKSPLLLRNLALVTFDELLIVFSTKVNLLYLIFNSPEVMSSAFDKAKLFAENFSKNSNLDDSDISLLP